MQLTKDKLLSPVVGFSACLGLTGCDSILDIATAPVAIAAGIHESIGNAQSRQEDEAIRKAREQKEKPQND